MADLKSRMAKREKLHVYDEGGHVPKRLKASLAKGEYVVRASVVPRHRRLLETINAKAK